MLLKGLGVQEDPDTLLAKTMSPSLHGGTRRVCTSVNDLPLVLSDSGLS